VLRLEHWECDDPVWWRPERGSEFRRLTTDDVAALRIRFADRERSHLIGH
jgi:hypothetical protein